MHIDAPSKYRPQTPVTLAHRRWPDATITHPPMWCSVDLRDGNQALIDPMDTPRKMRLWKALIAMGFKEIEIGFPAASQTDFDFVRTLVDGGHIPDDVTVQVLTQSRQDLIARTFDAIAGIKKVVVHLYNSTSEAQRRIVFGFDKAKCIELAQYGTRIIKEMSAQRPEGDVILEYSPESFTGTEPDFAVQVVEAVAEIWGTAPDRKMIVNLPATVEMYTPNVYADVIEWFCTTVKKRENLIISVHPHNDRGTAVAAAELGIMAGADRVEGTLFGNGERTGNVDICTLALNMFTQGVNPGLNISDIDTIRTTAEECTGISVHPRHPYAGDLVYTAFSGSHQDAIRKGMEAMKSHMERWEVPYLPIDPKDVGRSYDPIIRINSQSGKGGVTYVLEQNYGLHMPKAFQKNVGAVVTRVSDEMQSELSPEKIYEIFNQEYVDVRAPLQLNYYKTTTIDSDWDLVSVEAEIEFQGEKRFVLGEGNGVVSAFCRAIEDFMDISIDIVDYRGHSMEHGTKARAISYIQTKGDNGQRYYGAGTSSSVGKSSLRAVVSTINKMLTDVKEA